MKKKAVKKVAKKVKPTPVAARVASLAEAFYIQKNQSFGVNRLAAELGLPTETVRVVLDAIPASERKMKIANFDSSMPGVVSMTPGQASDDDTINKASANAGANHRMGSFHKINPDLPSR